MITLPLNDTAALKHFKAVQPRIVDRINSILKKGSIGRGLTLTALDNKSKLLLRALRRENWLSKIIICPPNEFIQLITNIIGMVPDLSMPTSTCSKVLYNLFIDSCYELSEHFDKLDFIKKIKVDSCVYCNRNYTYALERTKKIKPELDHFFPKAKYPYLGMSFYNLIPSCETCNGINAKHQSDPLVAGLKSPYLIDGKDFRFTYKLNSLNLINPFSSSVSIAFKSRIQGHLDVFKLDALYEKHSDHVLELIVKSKLKYSEHYRKHLQNLRGLDISENEINRMIIGNYVTEQEIHKRPFAKLYQDIAKELGLIPKPI